ncbi:TPA: hypothetical protein GDO54_018428 [Pyxicephalus adspersus]|uniref:G-protein coupled receptors family 1 profile domain-containing protein n=1 Tax=Pyxicephalus adspersus TaxID=30357 RepID=A0AAV2ZII3_PYXAD|nr:TPA: hypothetical protein GDO54_018428 [Pyxicephalus adspersus]
MENYTSNLEFHILPFFVNSDDKLLIFSIVFFFLIYLVGILVNITIIILICLDRHLHTPMYVFLCNLSVVDMCFTSVTIPKKLTNKICIVFMMVAWISACVNSAFMVNAIIKFLLCSSTTIHQFFCDAKALFNISCAGRDMFYLVVYVDYFVFGVCPVVCHLMSYMRIFKVILHINSKDGRRKALSTCSSHLTVMVIYYGSGASVYMTPPSEHSNILEEIFTVFYTTMTPLLNPLIYTLRNNEVKSSLLKLVTYF